MAVPKTARWYAPSTNATGIVDGTIVNADVNAAAAIAFTKLAALADGKILVGSAANVATAVTPSGDATISNAGVVSVVGGAAAAASDFTVTAVATKDIIMKLGDAAGVSEFKVADSADVVLFKVDSTGVITLEGGTTIDNSAAANTVTITETNIALVGAVAITGSIALPANTVNQAAMADNAIGQAEVADDAIGVAEAKIAVRDIQVGIGASSATVTTAADINGQLLNAYFVAAADATATQILRQEFIAASGKIEITVNAVATAATDIRCLVLQA